MRSIASVAVMIGQITVTFERERVTSRSRILDGHIVGARNPGGRYLRRASLGRTLPAI